MNFAKARTDLRGEELTSPWASGGAILNMTLRRCSSSRCAIRGRFEGAACATVLSQAVLAATLWWLSSARRRRASCVAASRAVLAEVAKVACRPCSCRCSRSSSRRSPAARRPSGAAREWQVLFGAALRIQSFAFIPLGMSNGFQPAAGTNYGAGLYDRGEGAPWRSRWGDGLRCCLWIPAMLFPEAALSLFITIRRSWRSADDFRVFFVASLASW
ncbi:MAG: hypothetical protein ACLTMP_08440 [Eggerthella lenta]